MQGSDGDIGPKRDVVAVLGGTGPEGAGLALRWVVAGYQVVIGSRDAERALVAAARIGDAANHAPGRGSVLGADNVSAAASAGIVVLAVPFGAQLATIKSIQSVLRPDQVLVDITVPLASAVGGRPTQLIGVWEGSAAERAAAAAPNGMPVVAAFHNVSAAHLEHLESGVECDVLVCGDDRSAKARVRGLVEAIPGARYVDAGPLANARTVEALTALLIGINIRYKVPGAGIRVTGLPGEGERLGA